MNAVSIYLRWTPVLALIALSGALLLTAPGAEGALDAVQLWNEDFTDEAKVIRDGAVIGITATDFSSVGGTRNATVSDPTNPGDGFNVTLYDDGTHGDAAANDGIYTGNFTVCSDGGSSGSCTNAAGGVIDIAEGDPVSVYVDLDGDGSYNQVTMSTDYTGPGMATPFTGGFVSGELIITITIIIEGEAPLDPASVTYSVDAGAPAMFTQIAPDTFQAIIDTFLLVDGPHVVSTLSADEAGNIGMGSFDIIVDNTVPDIVYACTTIASNGNVLIGTQVTDLHLDGDTIKWNWDDGDWVFPMLSGNDVFFVVTIPYDDIVPGEHSVTVTAKDLASNSMTLITRWILPEQDLNFLAIEPPVIDPYMYVGCETVPIPLELLNEGEVPLDLEFSLVVDELSVDTGFFRLDAGSDDTIVFIWPSVSPGAHDLKLVVNLVNDTTSGKSTWIVEVKDPDDNSLVMLPSPLHVYAFPITSDDIRPGDTVNVDSVISNLGDFPQEAIVQLVVDGEVVDTITTTIPAMTNKTVDLMWLQASEGTHDMEVRVFMPEFHGTEVPVDTYTVPDASGGSIRIEGDGDGDNGDDGDKSPVDQFLDAFEPVNQYLPMERVPEDLRPWLVPLLLIGILFIIGIVAVARKKPKKSSTPAKEPEIKPVEMPPVTGTGGTSTTTTAAPKTPEPSIEDEFPDRTEDEGEVMIPVDDDVGKTPRETGRSDFPYPTTAMTSDTSTGTTTTKDPDKPPASAPPIVPPIASTTKEDDGKGEPCVDIIEAYSTTARGISDADAAADDAKDDADDAQEQADKADLTADDAEEKAREAEKECDDAKKEYEGEGVGDAEKEAKKAEDRVKDLEDRMKELEGDVPQVDGVSLGPKPGYTHGGVGFGTMIHVTHVYYRDDQAEIDLNRELKKRYKEYKKLKKDLDDAKEEAKEAKKKAEEAREEAKDAKKKADEACEKARKAREEADRLRGAANDAQENAVKMGGEATSAANDAQEADDAATPDRKGVDDCKDCLAKVKRTKARIEELKRKYENLKGGSQMEGPRNRHSQMDAQGAWDQWWNSFKQFRDEAKRLMDMKSFTDADLPDEFIGVFDWGGPVGTAVGYGAEDTVLAPIPTDTIKAVGGIYAVFQGMFDPKYIMGAKILNLHLSSKEADQATKAFKSFPRVLDRALKSYEKLQRLVELDGKISDALSSWEDCLKKLPPAPETPEVDMNNLCYKQCLDKLKELEEAERKLRELIRRAEGCKPDGLDDMFAEGNKIKGQLNGMKKSMDRTRNGLENYRRAHRAHLGLDD